MRYLLLIGHEDKKAAPPAPAEVEAIVEGHRRVSEELRSKGRMIVSERLRPEAEATRVRFHGPVTDGPFAETKEALGGFYLIECDSKEEAIDWARKLPLRAGGFVEVRPIWPM
ncbi:MAG TPA: YciI family protein [Candidatus Tectomicrobia bacterium]|nr:YciI family protein [Candidatus Tectomicrobia bacterium]